jgi:UDP-N-acetylglucosamine 2-epimerase (non-hydrolysing)
MKIMTIVGARPNFMKAAPIIWAIRRHNEATPKKSRKAANDQKSTLIQHILVHTGQHYDQAMSDSFFADLSLPVPDEHLGVGSGSHASQTADVMKKFEEVLIREEPDFVIVVGDVNSTIACAIVTAKISFGPHNTRPLIAHVEAGLRSFDRTMPEEINRILTDHLSDVLFVTEKSGLSNLNLEGIPKKRIHFVGNTMIDSLRASGAKAEGSRILEQLGLLGSVGRDQLAGCVVPYAVLTLHRPGNVDHRKSFQDILDGLSDLSAKWPVIFPVHPRTRKRIEEFGLEKYFFQGGAPPAGGVTRPVPSTPGVILTSPLGYLDFLCLAKHASLVVTDSGGIQEETTCLQVPCVTVRENTERPITVTQGTNVIAGTSPKGIRNAIARQLKRKPRGKVPPKWDGKAAERIVERLVKIAAKGRSSR